jgi:hypothetical protein
MQTLTDAEQQWQDKAFESFFNMVKAPDGDFERSPFFQRLLMILIV